MSKKSFSFLIGVTLAVGALGSAVLQKKTKRKKSEANLAAVYAGSWRLMQEKKKIQHTLVITPKLEVILDEKKRPYHLVELSPEMFAFHDDFGFLIKITTESGRPKQLYDEMDDYTYTLIEHMEDIQDE